MPSMKKISTREVMAMPKSALFMLKTKWYGQIESGEKTDEYRAGDRWSWLFADQPKRAVLMSGRRRHAREIRHVDVNHRSHVPREVQEIYPGEEIIYITRLGRVIQ